MQLYVTFVFVSESTNSAYQFQALFCIREWKDGYYIKGKFNSTMCAQDYEGILKDAHLLQDNPATKELILTLRQWLYDNARYVCYIYRTKN